MQEFIQNFGTIIAIVTLIVAGAFAVYGLWDKNARERRRESDTSEDRLIDLLKKTVDELEKKVNKQTTDIETLTKQMKHLEKENETLVKVLQGRDDQTQQFYKQMLDSIKVAQSTHDTVTTLAKSVQDTVINMTKLIELLSQHLQVLDHKTPDIK